MDDSLSAFIMAVCFGLGIFIGFILFDSGRVKILTKCAKEHNVYQCKIIAVPMEKEE